MDKKESQSQKALDKQKITVNRLELKGCPEGEILNYREPDPAVDAFFEGWEAPLAGGGKRRGLLRVIYENGGPVIEHPVITDGKSVGFFEMEKCLTTGDPLWRDYVVEGNITLDSCDAKCNADNYYVNVRPMSGLVARMNDLRHYYFFALETPGDGRLVLYRRADDDWHVLAEKKFIVKDMRYYHLSFELSGDKLTCNCDGEEVFSVIDYAYPRGWAGVRFNTQSRVKDLKVEMSPGQLTWFKRAKASYQSELEEISAAYPKPVLCKTVDLKKYWPFQSGYEHSRVVTLNREGDKGFLLESESHNLVLTDVDGNLIWERDIQGYLPILGGPHADDSFDIFGVVDGKLTAIDGMTGSIAKQVPLPRLGESDQVSSWYPATGNLSGGPSARDFIIREISYGGGGTILWAFDHDLNLLWKVDDVYPMYGHAASFTFLDVDGDGRDEVYAGASLYSADGELLMRADCADEIAATLSYGVHVDAIVAGNFSDDPELDPVIFACAGSAGVFVINGITGETLSVHKVGHAQGCLAGNFNPELPGISVVVGTRWENFGILSYFSGRGDRLLNFQPDNVSQGGPGINWTGDGQELLLLNSSSKAFGMYDGKGRKVVLFPDELKQHREGLMIADVFGDARDELIFVVNGELQVYTQDNEFAGDRIYKPRRQHHISFPGWQEIGGFCINARKGALRDQTVVFQVSGETE